MMARGGPGRLRSRVAAPGRVRRAGRRKRGGWGSWPRRHRACVSTTRAPHLLGVQMEQHASHPNEKAKEESNAVPLCRAKPSPSFINLQASSPPATFLNIQRTKLPSEVSFFHGMCRKNWVGM
ncbi:TSSK6-activating co-chaperone protein isoform X6 [Canis lupus familiaris]|uniref:TSSK6-activating co-chaperone protein isoform X6 n=1 Tax=Canis lupus familiaris TaxID=9615 RepID=UPI0015F14E19|nr:TSSK6-activating co-chaperone protein isoform X6 [Canis lupus familiaris]XP_038426665.1 TSSK6-activating co-chaperone protein isoform X6 [Canis lupus familiaris]XP_038527794.1 TSSK6-activating co-chaperone protein isoform X6 [Canis lupus familiaris]